ncbi:hypothetical protein HDU76_004577 [Blyttiomyces sp. JEL0837]|nr:hypothetical protein HDU76_004577 [Blyttiomyces sp. JEL0837]
MAGIYIFRRWVVVHLTNLNMRRHRSSNSKSRNHSQFQSNSNPPILPSNKLETKVVSHKADDKTAAMEIKSNIQDANAELTICQKVEVEDLKTDSGENNIEGTETTAKSSKDQTMLSIEELSESSIVEGAAKSNMIHKNIGSINSVVSQPVAILGRRISILSTPGFGQNRIRNSRSVHPDQRKNSIRSGLSNSGSIFSTNFEKDEGPMAKLALLRRGSMKSQYAGNAYRASVVTPLAIAARLEEQSDSEEESVSDSVKTSQGKLLSQLPMYMNENEEVPEVIAKGLDLEKGVGPQKLVENNELVTAHLDTTFNNKSDTVVLKKKATIHEGTMIKSKSTVSNPETATISERQRVVFNFELYSKTIEDQAIIDTISIYLASGIAFIFQNELFQDVADRDDAVNFSPLIRLIPVLIVNLIVEIAMCRIEKLCSRSTPLSTSCLAHWDSRSTQSHHLWLHWESAPLKPASKHLWTTGTMFKTTTEIWVGSTICLLFATSNLLHSSSYLSIFSMTFQALDIQGHTLSTRIEQTNLPHHLTLMARYLKEEDDDFLEKTMNNDDDFLLESAQGGSTKSMSIEITDRGQCLEYLLENQVLSRMVSYADRDVGIA